VVHVGTDQFKNELDVDRPSLTVVTVRSVVVFSTFEDTFVGTVVTVVTTIDELDEDGNVDGDTIDSDNIVRSSVVVAKNNVQPGRLGTVARESSIVDNVKSSTDEVLSNILVGSSSRAVDSVNRGSTEDNDNITDGPLTVVTVGVTEGKTVTGRVVGTNGELDFDVNVGVGSTDRGRKNVLTVVTDRESLVSPGTNDVKGESDNEGLGVFSGGDTSDDGVGSGERTKDVGETVDTEVDGSDTDLGVSVTSVGREIEVGTDQFKDELDVDRDVFGGFGFIGTFKDGSVVVVSVTTDGDDDIVVVIVTRGNRSSPARLNSDTWELTVVGAKDSFNDVVSGGSLALLGLVVVVFAHSANALNNNNTTDGPGETS